MCYHIFRRYRSNRYNYDVIVRFICDNIDVLVADDEIYSHKMLVGGTAEVQVREPCSLTFEHIKTIAPIAYIIHVFCGIVLPSRCSK